MPSLIGKQPVKTHVAVKRSRILSSKSRESEFGRIDFWFYHFLPTQNFF